MTQNTVQTNNKFKKYLPVAAGVGTILIASQPANAQDAGGSDPVADVTSMVTSIGTITGSVVGVVIAAMTVRLAVKQVNRLMTKG